MAVSETQLDTWSAQGSIQQSATTNNSISGVLKDPASPYYPHNFETFLQGSYGNDTNIWADSDVDIVIRLSSVYYSDTDDLSPGEKANFDRNWSKAEYSLTKFKVEVTDWLKENYGAGVDGSGKAIFVPGNGTRRDADVLACAEHRDYISYPAYGEPSYREGIVFWTKDGVKIVNYPKQHSANCTQKHKDTNAYFKNTVRIFKNMRNRMIDEGWIKEGLAPSYFLEGLLSNVPDRFFAGSYTQTVTNCIDYASASDTSEFRCANKHHWLIRNAPVCWSPDDFEAYLRALNAYW
ncbi:nucleotidyltransferase [Rhizobium leguminosarum]|uniref:Nucleotidyltransferase n=1 Tax=Rhizobium leguminosarum TaxID=384 RepID=A0A4Q8XRT4_RHILE|nr:nucleotidyltransferase [Rhizobium leguminosarum]TAX64404.1 nucleotidyltransferase [Rhizobium leguminosarum]